jgi:hypothetical protein
MARVVANEGLSSEDPIGIQTLLTGILALLVADREERVNGREERNTDVVLAGAGLTYGEISRLTGRPYEAVKSAVRRSRGPGRRAA